MNVHQMHGLGGKGARGDRFAVARHHRTHGSRMEIDLLVERAAKVAVREHTKNETVPVDYHGHPQPLA